MSRIHITIVFSTERMKPDSWKIFSDFSDSLWTFFFFEVVHFIKDKKNEEKSDEGWSHDFHFLSKFKKWGG